MRYIKIISKRDNYYRAGIRHSRLGETHPAERFTEGELKRLQADPVLTVTSSDGTEVKTQDSEAAAAKAAAEQAATQNNAGGEAAAGAGRAEAPPAPAKPAAKKASAKAKAN